MSIFVSRSSMIRFAMFAAIVVLALGVASEFILKLHGPVPALKDFRHFTLNSEHNLSSWFSSALLAAGAGLTAWIALLDAERRALWLLHAAVMLACSVDESVSFHEALISIFGDLREVSPFLYFPWIVFGFAFSLVYGAFIVRVLSSLEPAHIRRFMLSAIVFLAGALGLEAIGGYLAAIYGESSLAYVFAFCVEETLETVGALLYLNAASVLVVDRMAQYDVKLFISD